MKKLNRTMMVAFSALLMVCASAAQAQMVSLMTTKDPIQVELGTHRLVRSGVAITRVAIGNPAIADVNVVNRREALISGKTLGVTSLIVWMGHESREYRVVVRPVVDPVQARSNDPELANAVVNPGQSLEGRLPNLLAYRHAQSTAQQGSKDKVADRSVVDGSTAQVMTEVKIAEVSRRTLQEYGLNLSKQGNGFVSMTTPGASPLVSGVPGSSFLPLQSAFNIVLGDAGRSLYGAISLLEQKGLARTLAEPSLVAMSGQTASYLAGGEFPVPVSQGSAAAGAVTIQYKEFGVRLNISPTVLSQGRIAMKIAPEVSDLDFSSGIQVGGVAVPSLTVRRTDTTIELGDGESFVISGLVSSNLINSVNKIPGLGDLPVLGAFFRSTSIRREDKELVMVVTPHVVQPLARDAQLPRLPGAKYDRYDPNFAQTMLFESGNFDIGFGR